MQLHLKYGELNHLFIGPIPDEISIEFPMFVSLVPWIKSHNL